MGDLWRYFTRQYKRSHEKSESVGHAPGQGHVTGLPAVTARAGTGFLPGTTSSFLTHKAGKLRTSRREVFVNHGRSVLTLGKVYGSLGL